MWNGFLVFARTVSAGFPSSFFRLRAHAFEAKDVPFAAKQVRKTSCDHSASIACLSCTQQLCVIGADPARHTFSHIPGSFKVHPTDVPKNEVHRCVPPQAVDTNDGKSLGVKKQVRGTRTSSNTIHSNLIVQSGDGDFRSSVSHH